MIVPFFLFAFGWFKPLVSAPIIVLLLAAVWLLWQKSRNENTKPDRNGDFQFTTITLIAVIGASVVWISLSGIGGLGFQNSDYTKHNVILHDLIALEWPVNYGGSKYLVYSFAYYLVPALFGKFGGWQFANVVGILWSGAGVFLSLLWFIRLVRLNSLVVLIIPFLFLLLGGMDLLGTYFLHGKIPRLGDHIEWWAIFTQFSSNSTLIIWVPQHAIVGWLLGGIIAVSWRDKNQYTQIGLIVALSALWSPFVTIGAAGLVAVLAVKRGYKRFVSLENLVIAPLLVAIVVVFYSANDFQIPMGPIWRWYPLSTWGWNLALFYLFEFGLLGFLTYGFLKNEPAGEREIFLAVMLMLVLLPLFKVGVSSDLTMRGSIPVLFIFWSFVVKKFVTIRGPFTVNKGLFVLILVLGFFSGVSELWRSVKHYNTRVPDEAGISQLTDIYLGAQYIGSKPSVYSKYLSK